jgi:tRNA 2-selenouridine synthase
MYKRQSSFSAKIAGAIDVARNIADSLEREAEWLEQCNAAGRRRFLVYCARGGQRSQSLATVLGRIGLDVSVLEGGYKAWRRSVQEGLTAFMAQFSRQNVANNRLVLLQAPTGSGKSLLLQCLKKMNRKGVLVLDLEDAAKHYGSILGPYAKGGEAEEGEEEEAELFDAVSQRSFETRLYWQILEQQHNITEGNNLLFVECESSRLGSVYVPAPVWQALCQEAQHVVQVDATLEQRADFIRRSYPHLEKEQYRDWLMQKLSVLSRVTGDKGKELEASWHGLVAQEAWMDLVLSLISNHYDRAYAKSSSRRSRSSECSVRTVRMPEGDITEESCLQLAQQLVDKELRS